LSKNNFIYCLATAPLFSQTPSEAILADFFGLYQASGIETAMAYADSTNDKLEVHFGDEDSLAAIIAAVRDAGEYYGNEFIEERHKGKNYIMDILSVIRLIFTPSITMELSPKRKTLLVRASLIVLF